MSLYLAPNKYSHISKALEVVPMQAHIVLALMLECRGFVRETPAQRRHLGEAPSSGGDGRPLGAKVDVTGINRTISASAEFGDFYRHVSSAHSAPLMPLLLTVSIRNLCGQCTANSDELRLQPGWQLSAQAYHIRRRVVTRFLCAGLLHLENTMSHSLSAALPMRPEA